MESHCRISESKAWAVQARQNARPGMGVIEHHEIVIARLARRSLHTNNSLEIERAERQSDGASLSLIEALPVEPRATAA